MTKSVQRCHVDPRDAVWERRDRATPVGMSYREAVIREASPVELLKKPSGIVLEIDLGMLVGGRILEA